MRFDLHIECDNAAFEADCLSLEIEEILKTLIKNGGIARLESDLNQFTTFVSKPLMDTNGNRVGEVRLGVESPRKPHPDDPGWATAWAAPDSHKL